MKLNEMLFVLAASALFAVGARAQDTAAPSPAPTAPTAAPADQGQTDKKMDWKANIKDVCSAEIADGGVCAGKDFGAGLERCLDHHEHKLSKDCRKAVRRHRRHWHHSHHDHGGDKGAAQPAAAPAPAPDAAPATPAQ